MSMIEMEWTDHHHHHQHQHWPNEGDYLCIASIALRTIRIPMFDLNLVVEYIQWQQMAPT